MDRSEFNRLLEKGALPSVLLFEGEEEHLKQSALAALRKRLLPEGMEQLNESLLNAPGTEEIIAAAETLPFLAERRLVVIEDHPALFGRESAQDETPEEAAEEKDDALTGYLKNVPPTALLCFYCRKKPNGRKRLYAAIKKMGGVVTFAPMRDRELTHFVTAEFKRLGKECDERTADFLVFTCGADANLLLGEIAKIAAHDPEASAVRAEEVSALATPSLESTVFQMVDAVVTGQKERALTLMRNQLRLGTDRVFMLAMLLRQFRLLQHVKIMQFEKRSPQEIKGALGVPAFAADQYLRQASAWSGGQVKRAVNLCFDTEYAIKSGRLNAEGAVEGVLLRLLTMREK